MDYKITSEKDVLEVFRACANQKIPPTNSKVDLTYGYPRVPNARARILGKKGVPDVGPLKPLVNLLDVNEVLNRNLNYMSPLEDWKKFYCFPDDALLAMEEQIIGVDRLEIANSSPSASSEFRDRVIKHSVAAVPNRESQFVFLSGTTGVGKTTFVKYHARTEKEEYLSQNVIISRVKFGDIEAFLGGQAKSKKASQTEGLRAIEDHLVNCLFRDVIESLAICTSKSKKTEADKFIQKTLEDAISEAENQLILLKDNTEDPDEEYISEYLLFNRIQDIELGQIAKIGIERKLMVLKKASSILKFVMFLDGFDAIQPEEIFLDFENEKQDLFLYGLEAIITGDFGGVGPVRDFFSRTPMVFCVSVRKVTISQLKLCLTAEVKFDQIVAGEEFIVASPVFDIVRKRCNVRTTERRLDISDAHIESLVLSMQKALSFIRQDFGMPPDGKFITLFNHNVREKLTFLRDLTDFFLKALAKLIHEDPLIRKRITTDRTLDRLIADVTLEDLEVSAYEFEKILILNNEDYFANYFQYDIRRDLVQVDNRGAFDNIFSYRIIPEDGKDRSSGTCPLLVKLYLLRKIYTEQGVTHSDCCSWLDSYFPKGTWSPDDFKLLIRGWLIEAEFDMGDFRYRVSEKGKFVLTKLIYKFSYFERACMSSRLPKHIRRKLHPPQESSGGKWGRSSIVNVAVFLAYIRFLEEQQGIPVADRLAGEFQKAFEPIIIRTSAKGLEDFKGYSDELRGAFVNALT